METVITNAASVIGAECSEVFSVWNDGKLELDAVDAALDFNGAVSVLINVRSLKFIDVSVNSALIRILKYQGGFDLDISFDEDDDGLADVDGVGAFFAFSKEVAKKFEFGNCYFGMEPASEENTRFFTNDVLGPLK
ncbi:MULTISPECIES: hypothetical protein [unclassified Pseudomonas]|uniref:hypothetical protein n=1 Tax=unclassified Pseudomonas TaxID=196821 RepID=UPI001F56AB29|nr:MULTISPECIES: hypothetical protein [unclassified Pseudomonas]